MAVLTVDVGFWLGDRRDAQTDVDLAALAGAQELPNVTDDAGASAAAYAAAMDWIQSNDVDPANVTVEVVDDCFSADDGVSTGVRVSLTRETRTFLLGFFSDQIPTVGATALACTGTPVALNDFLPFALSEQGSCFEPDPLHPGERKPIYGQRCEIVVGGSSSSGGDIGQLGFDTSGICNDGSPSASLYEQYIIYGVPTTCAIGDSVTSNPGVNVGKSLSGLEGRLALEGDCGTQAQAFYGTVVTNTNNFNSHPTLIDLGAPDFGGIDDFFEIWGPHPTDYNTATPGEHLVQYDCSTAAGQQTSPRSVVVVIVNSVAAYDGTACDGGANPHCYIVQGFARMYLEGCENSNGWSNVCDLKGGGGTFTIHGRFVESAGDSHGQIGLEGYGTETVTFLKE
jgi:hypothetical protein